MLWGKEYMPAETRQPGMGMAAKCPGFNILEPTKVEYRALSQAYDAYLGVVKELRDYCGFEADRDRAASVNICHRASVEAQILMARAAVNRPVRPNEASWQHGNRRWNAPSESGVVYFTLSRRGLLLIFRRISF
jgi:hypothetical protein